MNKYYTGIGSRNVPDDILSFMTELARYMSGKGFILRSGGANGSDNAFERGSGSLKNIFLPSKNFCGRSSMYTSDTNYRTHVITGKAVAISEKVWDDRYKAGDVKCVWSNLKDYTKRLMARNCYQVLGAQLDNPSKVVICYTKDGLGEGGTGHALHLARHVGIEVYDLGDSGDMDYILEKVLF